MLFFRCNIYDRFYHSPLILYFNYIHLIHKLYIYYITTLASLYMYYMCFLAMVYLCLLCYSHINAVYSHIFKYIRTLLKRINYKNHNNFIFSKLHKRSKHNIPAHCIRKGKFGEPTECYKMHKTVNISRSENISPFYILLSFTILFAGVVVVIIIHVLFVYCHSTFKYC